MIEDPLDNRLRRLPFEPVPPSPWLEDRVTATVSRAVSKLDSDGARHSLRFKLAGLAAVVMAALLVGLLIGSRLSAQQVPAPAEGNAPSRDASVVRYRATVDADLRAIDRAFVNGQCATRAACLASLAQTRSAAAQLRGDMTAMAAPGSIRSIAANVIAADTQFIVQVDAASALMSEPGSDFASADAIPNIADLELAVAQLDCWPASPVQGDHGIACS